jgi:hypothetical protein
MKEPRKSLRDIKIIEMKESNMFNEEKAEEVLHHNHDSESKKS